MEEEEKEIIKTIDKCNSLLKKTYLCLTKDEKNFIGKYYLSQRPKDPEATLDGFMLKYGTPEEILQYLQNVWEVLDNESSGCEIF